MARWHGPPIAESFWDHVDKSGGPDACWPWLRGGSRGYGCVVVNERKLPAHRHALELTSGTLAPGLFACHHCDNRRCCNPAHLYAGTHADNMRDRTERNRQYRPIGVLNVRAKLTPERVVELRRRYAAGGMTQTSLAREFGVSVATVNEIVRGKYWKSVAA